MRLLIPLIGSVLVCQFSAAAERWADAGLTVTNGLELWLDAKRSAGAQTAPVGKVAQWQDGSGRGRHLLQSIVDAQPVRLETGGVALMRFDGVDDHLRAVKQTAELESFTIFMVTAPRRNAAVFRGLMAFNAADKRDYQSGLNIDLGPYPTPRFTVLNIEGPGFGGAGNLRTGDDPFGLLHTIEVTSAAKDSVRIAVNGKVENSRPRDSKSISLEEITLGARFYNNGPGAQHVDGHARCDIAEVLVYNRVLSAEETKAVRGYLTAKYAELKKSLPADAAEAGNLLTPVKDPPPVQVLVPGFTVRELPVKLNNVNNIMYRPDGTLVALCYDGTVWLLRDSDGDGLEDKATQFWDNRTNLRAPIGMDLTPPKYEYGDGVFVAGKGRCVLIVDTDGDDKADKEIVIADGWKEPQHNVDAVGIAFDSMDNSIYFGRGAADYTNAYLLDKNGKAHYSLKDERGTIQRIAPNFSSREIICTGVRFPVGMRISRQRRMFVTDQEGATWLPNGNPFDELLHIMKDQHYGFPPRHPKHLPNVTDVPSNFDYGPQHQSTCGLCFNEPVRKNGPTFGPKAWEDDVFVAGYSRGKIFRTKLFETTGGYVGKTVLFACLNMLTADVCISTAGDLVAACHSGGPDWGSGPSGQGKLYKIAYSEREHAQPVLIWPAAPREIRIAFDSSIDPALLRDAQKQIKVTAGKFVRAGDRFESLWPGYAVVQQEKLTPRFDVPVRGVQLTPDGRTLILATDPITAAVHYSVTLPGLGRPARDKTLKGNLAQVPEIDLDFDLSGCQATCTDRAGKVVWSGWMPSIDLGVAQKLTTGSLDHVSLFVELRRLADLRIQAQLDLHNVMRPAVQPGAQLDYELPPERVYLMCKSAVVQKIESPDLVGTFPKGRPGDSVEEYIFAPKAGKLTQFDLQYTHRLDRNKVDSLVSLRTDEKQIHRPFQLHRALLPWADTSAKALEPVAPKPPAELAGGSWARGRNVFFSDTAACSKCHAIHGQGESIGPDLSNLIHRDYASVLRDITQPSFAINPDHLTYVVNLLDGRTLTGVVQSAGNKLRIADNKGVVTEIERNQVDSMRPSAVSTMPDDIVKVLGPDKLKDLLTYLLTNPISMPRDYPGPRPKARTVAEVNAVLAGAPVKPAKSRQLRIVLVAGPKDHGPGEHDYPAWQKAWKELLGAAPNVDVGTAWEWPAKEDFAKTDVFVFFQHGDWNARRAADIDAFLERGGGLVYIHWAVDGQKEGVEFARRIGLAGRGAVGFRHGDLLLTMNKESKHPVLRNFDKLALTDESYWNMAGDLKPERVLATAIEDKQPRPQFWSLEPGQGRVFVSIPGHYSWTFDDPLFRILLLRGMAWSAKEPVDRFNELVWPGANVAR